MFYSYNYFRQYNNNEEIKDHKRFIRNSPMKGNLAGNLPIWIIW